MGDVVGLKPSAAESENPDTAANPDTPAEGYSSLAELAEAVENGHEGEPDVVAVNDLPNLQITIEAAPDGSCVLVVMTTIFGSQIYPLDPKIARGIIPLLKEKAALADKNRAKVAAEAKQQLTVAKNKLQLPGRDF